MIGIMRNLYAKYETKRVVKVIVNTPKKLDPKMTMIFALALPRVSSVSSLLYSVSSPVTAP